MYAFRAYLNKSFQENLYIKKKKSQTYYVLLLSGYATECS